MTELANFVDFRKLFRIEKHINHQCHRLNYDNLITQIMRFILLAFLFCPSLVFSQFSDNFSDGDFSSNPTWLGDTDNFTINNGELQLNDADFSTPVSQLYSSVLTKDSTNWECYVRMDFKPSNSNYAKIYLQSDNSDLTGPLNGYFIRVGGVSGDLDSLELYR